MSELRISRYGQKEMKPPLDDQMQKLLKGLLSMQGVRHAVLAVESMDRSIGWIGAAGEANQHGEPMLPETPFFIASVDKMLTSAAVLKLYEDKLLDLDESLTAYLPQEMTRGIHVLNGLDYTGKITIRHLLSHTSGLADYLEDRRNGGRCLIDDLVEGPDRVWKIDEFTDIVRSEMKPHFPPEDLSRPRQTARYVDTNYLLLIGIIESLTAKPLHQAYKELLFTPLGMHNTFLLDPSEALDPTPAAAALWFGDKVMQLPMIMSSLKSVYSTAGDVLVFLRSLLQGDVFTNADTFRLMTRRWNRFGFPFFQAALRSPSWPIEYGLGLMRFKIPRLFSPFYDMPEIIGHSGSTGTWLFHSPKLDLLLAGTVDQGTAGPVPFRLLPKVLRIVDKHLER